MLNKKGYIVLLLNSVLILNASERTPNRKWPETPRSRPKFFDLFLTPRARVQPPTPAKVKLPPTPPFALADDSQNSDGSPGLHLPSPVAATHNESANSGINTGNLGTTSATDSADPISPLAGHSPSVRLEDVKNRLSELTDAKKALADVKKDLSELALELSPAHREKLDSIDADTKKLAESVAYLDLDGDPDSPVSATRRLTNSAVFNPRGNMKAAAPPPSPSVVSIKKNAGQQRSFLPPAPSPAALHPDANARNHGSAIPSTPVRSVPVFDPPTPVAPPTVNGHATPAQTLTIPPSAPKVTGDGGTLNAPSSLPDDSSSHDGSFVHADDLSTSSSSDDDTRVGDVSSSDDAARAIVSPSSIAAPASVPAPIQQSIVQPALPDQQSQPAQPDLASSNPASPAVQPMQVPVQPDQQQQPLVSGVIPPQAPIDIPQAPGQPNQTQSIPAAASIQLPDPAQQSPVPSQHIDQSQQQAAPSPAIQQPPVQQPGKPAPTPQQSSSQQPTTTPSAGQQPGTTARSDVDEITPVNPRRSVSATQQPEHARWFAALRNQFSQYRRTFLYTLSSIVVLAGGYLLWLKINSPQNTMLKTKVAHNQAPNAALNTPNAYAKLPRLQEINARI